MILECSKIVWFWETVFSSHDTVKMTKRSDSEIHTPMSNSQLCFRKMQVMKETKIQEHHLYLEIFSFPDLKRAEK